MSASARERLVRAALSWEGTPYRSKHYPVKGPNGGCDCVTFLFGVGIEAGLLPAGMPMPAYSAERHLHRSDEQYHAGLINHGFTELDPAAAQPGDILLEVIGGNLPSSHASIVLERDAVRPRRVIMATNNTALMRVARYRLDAAHWRRIRRAYRYPGVADE